MTNSADYILVHGDFVMDSKYGHNGIYDGATLSDGILEVKGNFTQLSSYSGPYATEKNFYTKNNHKVILSGDGEQIVSFEDPSSSYSHFNILELNNTSAEGVEFATAVVITNLFNHYQNNFTLSDTENSLFPDYDGDGVNDNEDGYPTDNTQHEFDNNANAQKMSSIKVSSQPLQTTVLSRDETTSFTIDATNGLKILDISDPETPVILSIFERIKSLQSILLSIDESYAFLANGDEGISILDITNLEDSILVGKTQMEAYAKEMILSSDESQLFVVDGKGGLTIVDISDLENPFVVKTVEIDGAIYGLSMSSDRSEVYIVDGDGVVSVMVLEEFEA